MKYFIIGIRPDGEPFVAYETTSVVEAHSQRNEFERTDGTGWRFRVCREDDYDNQPDVIQSRRIIDDMA